MEAAMLNPKDVIIQANDKKRENVQWIERDAILSRAKSGMDPKSAESPLRSSNNVTEIIRSLFVLKRPAHGHK
jgi:hypothetical protein